MSFDTFKSVKAQQIDLPSSLTMILPHDYVNYTQLSWVDGSGIKHPLYPTSHTSNPFQIRQDSSGAYDFPEQYELVSNNNFSKSLADSSWQKTTDSVAGSFAGEKIYPLVTEGAGSKSEVVGGELRFTNCAHSHGGVPNGKAQAVWQKISVTGIEYLDIEASATSTAETASTWTVSSGNPYASDNTYTYVTGPADDQTTHGPEFLYLGNQQHGVQGSSNSFTLPATTVRVGISSTPGASDTSLLDTFPTIIPFNPNTGLGPITTGHVISPNSTTDIFDIDYLEWTEGEVGYKYKTGVDVREYDTVYVLVTSTAFHTEYAFGEDWDKIKTISTVDDISVKNSSSANQLQHPEGLGDDSSTWNSYKSLTPSENDKDDYQDDTYWPHHGERYGLEPSHAQVNGSFYIDDRLGKINFSSNISGKTVILDYISDSLGTEDEMQVHKLAEDAMYKSILCDVMSTRRNVGRGQIMLYKKDKFAAIRKAKLRLSNVKLEELTQILRGKSKWIKH